MKWQPAYSAPRNGETFVGDFGDGVPVMTVWNGAHSDWCTAKMEASKYRGHDIDRNFSNAYVVKSKLKRWLKIEL